MSLPDKFPSGGSRVKKKSKDSPMTEEQRKKILQNAGFLNLGDPSGPPPSVRKKRKSSMSPNAYERIRRRVLNQN